MLAKRFVIIDGNSLANRAFYAIPMLSNSKGFITNAIYGFCNMLFKILAEQKPDYIAVAFDKGKVVFRHEEFKDYKAQRKGTPDELRPQFPVLKKLLQAMNIAIYEIEGYEADDIIGTLAKKAEKEGLESVILTGDRDALQLISPPTKVLLTRKGITELDEYDEEELFKKYGIKPEQMVELKGLMGDASDNIPGIPGVGEKTALKLIVEYGKIENVLEHQDEFQGKKLGNLLKEYGEQAILSRRLATIHCNVPLTSSLGDCRIQSPNYPELIEMLQELEFRNILQNILEKDDGAKKSELEATGNVITSLSALQEELAIMPEEISLTIEVQKKGVREYTITHFAIKGRGQNPLWLSWTNKQELEDYLQALKPLLEESKVKKTVHDYKLTFLAFAQYGINLQGIVYDTLLMGYLLNPSRSQTDIYTLAGEYNNIHIVRKEDKKEEAFALLTVLEDLGPLLFQRLSQQEMGSLYQDLELPLSKVLAVIEMNGILLDRSILYQIGKELEVRINSLTEQIYELAQEEFNINSPKQLGVILFEKLSLPRGKKTKTGYSTSAEVLETLALDHDIVAKILNYRQLVKLKSTYVDGLQNIMDVQTGKVHTSLNQTVTATGRLSSTEPNLQNIPIRMEEGRRIRKAFLASPDCTLLAADYSQIELRVLAHISQDEVLREAFHLDQDIHTRTAAEVFGVSMDNVTKEMRRAAKAVNFGIVYGISDFGLSQDLGISRLEAKEYIDSYFKRYRGVKEYIEMIIAKAREKGYVTTILNRRRYLPDILSRNFHLRSFAERMAMNTPIQGSAADIIKIAMLKAQQMITSEELNSRMVLQVHDELIFDVPSEQIYEMGERVNQIMSKAYALDVPLKVDLQTGPNWYDLEPLKLGGK